MKHKANARLKKCPLCARHAEITSPVDGVFNISCGDNMDDACGLVLFGGSGHSLEDMIRKWNTRKRVRR